MTKKDFELIAKVLAIHAPMDMSFTRQIARDFADRLKQDNSRFDRSRFLAACGVE